MVKIRIIEKQEEGKKKKEMKEVTSCPGGPWNSTCLGGYQGPLFVPGFTRSRATDASNL